MSYYKIFSITAASYIFFTYEIYLSLLFKKICFSITLFLSTDVPFIKCDYNVFVEWFSSAKNGHLQRKSLIVIVWVTTLIVTFWRTFECLFLILSLGG